MVIGNYIFFYELLLILKNFMMFVGFVFFSLGLITNNNWCLLLSFFTVYIQYLLIDGINYIKNTYLYYIDNYNSLIDT